MAARTQTRIRRDINRCQDCIDAHPEQPALQALRLMVTAKATAVNRAAELLAAAKIKQNKEAAERDDVQSRVLRWIQQWRPVVLTLVPGADLKALPPRAATADDLARLASDIKNLLTGIRGPDGQPPDYVAAALAELGQADLDVKRETLEAVQALADEEAAEQAFAAATADAAPVIIQASHVIRAIFGSKSHQFKRLVQRSSAQEAAVASEVSDGEPEPVA